MVTLVLYFYPTDGNNVIVIKQLGNLRITITGLGKNSLVRSYVNKEDELYYQ